jgi:hypothetical protein
MNDHIDESKLKVTLDPREVADAVNPHNHTKPAMIGLTAIEDNGYSIDVRTLAPGTAYPALILPNKSFFRSDIIVLGMSTGAEVTFLGWLNKEGFDLLVADLSDSQEVYIPAGLLYPS